MNSTDPITPGTAHIALNNPYPGITGLMEFRKETAPPLNELAETLLRGPSSLTSGERELIATLVSSRNDCLFCQSCHGAAAAHHLEGDYDLVDAVKRDFESADVSPKMKALLNIASKVQMSGKLVTAADIARAKAEGATDLELHDTVLIAAAFCMYNRYVDGLGTWAPTEREAYFSSGKRLAEIGYNPATPYPKHPS